MNSKMIRKILSIQLMLFLLLSIIACNGSVAKVAETTIEETTMKEKIEDETIARINIDDIEDERLRTNLFRIDKVNQEVGKLAEVSREDYLKYRDTKVSLIGDSLADCSKAQLIEYFNNIHIDAVAGRELSKGPEVYDNMEKRDKIGDVMVFELGTNAISGIIPEVYQYVYDKLNGKPMVMLTIAIPYEGQMRNRNRDIMKFVNTHKNVYLADWNAVVKKAHKEKEYLVEDGTHPTGAGSEVFAQIIFKAVVDACKDNNIISTSRFVN